LDNASAGKWEIVDVRAHTVLVVPLPMPKVICRHRTTAEYLEFERRWLSLARGFATEAEPATERLAA
jgi:hypothetical protein